METEVNSRSLPASEAVLVEVLDFFRLLTASAQYGSDFPRDPNASGPTAPTSERRHPVRIGCRDGQFS